MVREQIEMPQAGPVHGLEFRLFEGESDFPAMISVIDAAKRADGVERTDTVADLATNYRRLVNCDPYRDVCIATMHGKVVGYSRVWWEKQADDLAVYLCFGFLHPEWRRKGIGRDMLAWNQKRLKEIAAGLPAAERAVFRSMADGGEIGAMALLESNGYVPVTFGASMSRTLTADLPEMSLPAGLVVPIICGQSGRPTPGRSSTIGGRAHKPKSIGSDSSSGPIPIRPSGVWRGRAIE